jgi:hypothetical protein
MRLFLTMRRSLWNPFLEYASPRWLLSRSVFIPHRYLLSLFGGLGSVFTVVNMPQAAVLRSSFIRSGV